MKNLWIVSSFIFLLGCSKSFNIKEMPGTTNKTPPKEETSPIIPISNPAQIKWQGIINFGSFLQNASAIQSTAILKNIGGQTSQTLNLSRSGSSQNLQLISDACSNKTLASGESCLVTIQYNPLIIENTQENITATDGSSVDILLLQGNVLSSEILVSNSSIQLNEDTPYSGILTAIDPLGDNLIYSVLGNSQHGTLTINSSGTFQYTPNLNWSGSDSFTFQVSSIHNTKSATVSITVLPINDVPTVVNPTNLGTLQNTLLTSNLNNLTSDIDGDILTYEILTVPTNGNINLTGTSFNYTPHNNFVGTDTFTFRAYDGVAYSNIGTINISVSSTNIAPVLSSSNINLTVAEDSQISNYDLNTYINDTDSSFTYTITQSPVHGTASISSSGLFQYTPTSNYHGTDTLKFKVNDGQVDSNIATITITVTSVNDVPTLISPLSFSTNEDTPLNAILTSYAWDQENDSLSYEITVMPVHGTASIIGGTLNYVPDANFYGTDTLKFRVFDGTDYSSESTINLTINSVNDAPLAINCSPSNINEDTSVQFTCISDADGDKPKNYELVTQPLHGTVSIVDYSLDNTQKAFLYTPSSNWFGTDSWTYKVYDGQAWSVSSGTASVTVLAVNDAPVVQNASFNTDKNTPHSEQLIASDIEGDSLSFVVITQPSHGTVSIASNGIATYTPNNGYFGPDSFTYKAVDATLDSNVGTVSITVIDTAPIATWSGAVTAFYLKSIQSATPSTEYTSNSFTLSGGTGTVYVNLTGDAKVCISPCANWTSATNSVLASSGDTLSIRAYAPASGTTSIGVSVSTYSTNWKISTTKLCPTNFVLVPGENGTTQNEFCVAKYEMKIAGQSSGYQTYSASFVAESRADGTSWRNLSLNQMDTSCRALGANYDLISNQQWNTLARNIASVSSNWSGGSVGSGQLAQGNRSEKNNVEASTDDNLGCANLTGVTGGCSASVWNNYRRTNTLSNGEVIWDVAGNSWEGVKDTYSDSNTLAKDFVANITSGTFFRIMSGSQGYSCGTPNSGNTYCGFGYAWTSNASVSSAIYRGGSTSNGNNAGVFAMDFDYDRNYADGGHGFRCISTVGN